MLKVVHNNNIKYLIVIMIITVLISKVEILIFPFYVVQRWQILSGPEHRQDSDCVRVCVLGLCVGVLCEGECVLV